MSHTDKIANATDTTDTTDIFEAGDHVRIYNDEGRYTGPGLVLCIDEENRVMVQHFTTLNKHIEVFPLSQIKKIKI